MDRRRKLPLSWAFTRNAGGWEATVGLLAVALALPAAAQNATGEPAISGLWVVGEELTAVTDGIADPQGMSRATFAYRWIRVDAGGTETDIAGATASTYTLAAAEEGRLVKVKVTFSDDAGNQEERTSGAYPGSGNVLPEACDARTPYTTLGTELWSATMIVGTGGFHWGFDRGTYAGSFGELSDTTVRFGRPPTTVESELAAVAIFDGRLLVGQAFNETLLMRLSSAISGLSESARKLVFQSCGEVVYFPEVGGEAPSGDNSLAWYTRDRFNWWSHSTRRMRLYFDNSAPIAVAAEVTGTRRLSIRFSEPLRSGTRVATADFSVEVNGVVVALASSQDIVPTGRTVVLTLATGVAVTDMVEVRYTDPGGAIGTRLADPGQNTIGDFSNDVVVVAPPTPTVVSQSLAADGVTLSLTYDRELDESSVPTTDAFVVKVGGAVRGLAPAAPVRVSGRTVVLTLAKPAYIGETVTMAYTKPAHVAQSP